MACSFALLLAVMYEVLVTEIKGSDPALPKLPPDLRSLVTSVHITDLLQTRLPTNLIIKNRKRVIKCNFLCSAGK